MKKVIIGLALIAGVGLAYNLNPLSRIFPYSEAKADNRPGPCSLNVEMYNPFVGTDNEGNVYASVSWTEECIQRQRLGSPCLGYAVAAYVYELVNNEQVLVVALLIYDGCNIGPGCNTSTEASGGTVFGSWLFQIGATYQIVFKATACYTEQDGPPLYILSLPPEVYNP